MQTVLIIDDNQAVRTALEVLLSLHDVETVAVASPEEGLAAVDDGGVDLVIQDMNFSADTTSGEEGRELFAGLRRLDPDLPVILLTAWTHLEHAVELVKAGAADYLEKPWDDHKLVTTVRNLLRLSAATQANRRASADRAMAHRRLANRFDLCGLIYDSEEMHSLVTMATQIAHADVPVLITGPNGSGKEKLADILHSNSPRRDGPYVKVNVGALPTDLLESELFGTEPGAFTGASKARKGRFEAADGGTLFLDEIGELPLSGQVKLLRVLQAGEFQRLGSHQTRTVSVRVISATNSDLAAAVESGAFREDLYYRLNVIELELPALADRPRDVLPIAESFLDDGFTFTEKARQALVEHEWPGNVRELENRIRRATLLAESGTVGCAELGLDELRARSSPKETRSRRGREPTREEIVGALESADWVVSRAARALGLSRQALYRRIDKYEIGDE